MTALRGSTLNSHSYETDRGVVLVETVPHAYHCPAGHVTSLRFAFNADEVPATWDCPKCGRIAHQDETAARRLAGDDGHTPALFSPRTSATGKTHWDMLLERRSVAELEDLLAERVQLLRASRS
jgi:RNA polymerase-binding protein